jgi:hypothetical protein
MSYVTDPAVGNSTALNITASTTIKVGKGIIGTLLITSPPTTSGAIHDAASVGAASASNLIAQMPIVGPAAGTIGITKFGVPVFNGITVVLTGGSPVLAMTYS